MSLVSARSATLAAALSTSLFVFAQPSAFAQDAEHEWQKTYSLSGNPSLTIETGDSGLEIRSCGDCKEIQIHVRSGEKLTDYRLEEHQDGDHVSFSFKEKPHIGVHINWKPAAPTMVSVETPTSLELDAKSADGNVSVRGLSGRLQVRSGDGNVSLEDVRGDLHLSASDGNISIHNAAGTLEARASDGQMKIDGQFTAVQLHTTDGNLDFALAPGSQLSAASRIESSDGQVSVHVPHTLAANLDISSSDGHVDCALPLTMDHYDSNESSGHHLHGQLNAGGTPFSIHTSDGNVTITAI
jgi:hypothetical protein